MIVLSLLFFLSSFLEKWLFFMGNLFGPTLSSHWKSNPWLLFWLWNFVFAFCFCFLQGKFDFKEKKVPFLFIYYTWIAALCLTRESNPIPFKKEIPFMAQQHLLSWPAGAIKPSLNRNSAPHQCTRTRSIDTILTHLSAVSSLPLSGVRPSLTHTPRASPSSPLLTPPPLSP